MFTYLLRSLIIALLCLNLLPSYGNNTQRSVLPPEKAFNLFVDISEQNLNIDIAIKSGYYLYQSKFLFNSTPNNLLGSAQYSKPISHTDEFFGEQQIFRENAHISLPILSKAPKTFTLSISLQGCSDIGICYPPSERLYQIDGSTVTSLDPTVIIDNKSFISQLTKNKNTAKLSDEPFTLIPAEYKNDTPDEIDISWQNLWWNLLLFFLAGIAMSLTACMYPLVPIISSIIVNQQKNQARSIRATLIYTQGLACTYTLLGVIASLSGILLNVYSQQAIFIIPASLLILLLGLSMLDVFQLQLPTSWQNKLNNQNINTKNKSISVFLMGCISALIIGPCIAPPLAFALGYISSTHNIVLGALALYAMGLGMGLPLLIFSILGDRYLPKAGNWMNTIRYLLGVFLIFISVYLMSPFLPSILSLVLYSIVFLLPILIFYQQSAQTRIGQLLNWSFTIISILLVVYLLSSYFLHKNNTFTTFLSVTPKNDIAQMTIGKRYTNVQELMHNIKTSLKTNHTIYLDFYADWCTSCKKMEKYTFSDSRVKKLLNKNNFFQIDITENTPEQRKLMRMFNLYAPPGFFIIKAPNLYSKPLLGFEEPTVFLQWIKRNSQF